MTFYTKTGVTYQIAVDGYSGDSGNISLHVVFTQASYSLTVITNPPDGGVVLVDPLPDQSGRYAPNSVVTLTAIPFAGNLLTDWTGSVSTTNNPFSLSMNSNRTVTADFSLAPPKLMAYPQPSPASISTDGFRFFLIGPTNSLYVIEDSPYLTDWTPFQTNRITADQGTEIRDYRATNQTRRFYRARRVP